MSSKVIILISSLWLSAIMGFAQELNCRVVVNADQVESSDKRVFKEMETTFAQFLNNQSWTDDSFDSHERINCNIIITLGNPKTIGSYEANVLIQSERPVHNSNYESIMFNFADRDWQFEYVDSQPLQYNDNTFLSNLTSLLAFYAYVIIGLDYDSFGDLAGTPYFQKALNVTNNAQQSGRTGWDALNSSARNRYWLIENLTNSQMQSIRKGLYTYHRLALDAFNNDAGKSRKQILEILKDLKKVKDTYPNSILVITFLDAKSDELVNIFSEGDLPVRREAFDILSTIDPSNRGTYQKIIK